MTTEIIETPRIDVAFELPLSKRDKSFGIEQFNYSDGTYFQKFKNRVDPLFYPVLRDLDNSGIDITVFDAHDGKFKFSLTTSHHHVDSFKAEQVTQSLITLVKKIHHLEYVHVEAEFEAYTLMKMSRKKEVLISKT